MNIGEKLKKLRLSRDLTLDDIAKKSGVGKATLSRIENNITAGTLRTHMKICDALSIDLKALYEGLDVPQEEITAVGLENIHEADLFAYDSKAQSIILTKNAQKKNMLPQMLIIEPQGKTHVEQNSSGTEKFLYCLEGQVQIDIEGKQFDVKQGISLYFKSSLPHFVANKSKKTARCLVVTSPVAL